MGIRQIATEAYLRVEALEELLISKGLIQTGEAEAHKKALIEEKSRRHTEALKKFWERVEDEDSVTYQPVGIEFGWKGKLIAKSVTPFQALTVGILDRWGGCKYKRDSEYTLKSFSPSDITVWHNKGFGAPEKPPEWGSV